MQIPPKGASTPKDQTVASRLRTKSSLLCLSLSLLLSTQTANATTEMAMDLPVMTSKAEAIVTAEVVSTDQQTVGNSVQTAVQLRVTDSLKGDADGVIELILPGGSFTSGRFKLGMVNAGSPKMFVSQDGVYFLRQNSNEDSYQLIGVQQGYMPIRDTDAGQVIQNEATGGKAMSLSDMKAKIITAGGN